MNRFEREHLKGVKPTAAASYKSALKIIRVAPEFKDRPIRLITYEDVRDFHQDEDGAKTTRKCLRSTLQANP